MIERLERLEPLAVPLLRAVAPAALPLALAPDLQEPLTAVLDRLDYRMMPVMHAADEDTSDMSLFSQPSPGGGPCSGRGSVELKRGVMLEAEKARGCRHTSISNPAQIT